MKLDSPVPHLAAFYWGACNSHRLAGLSPSNELRAQGIQIEAGRLLSDWAWELGTGVRDTFIIPPLEG